MSLDFKYEENEKVHIIKVPTLVLDFDSCFYLSSLFDYILKYKDRIIALEFDDCDYIAPPFLSFLGGIRKYFNPFDKHLFFSLDSKEKPIFNYLYSSGFYNYFENKDFDFLISKSENVLPFSRIDLIDEKQLFSYVEKIIDLLPVSLSPGLSDIIFQNIYEIFTNAIEHSNSTCGVYSCGHWDSEKKEFIFSVYDVGIGIPDKIKTMYNCFQSHEALLWALQKGNSTLQLKQGSPRGVGLYTLLQFVVLNHGSLTIFTNDVYYYCSANNSKIEIMPYSIPGTLISITIVANDVNMYATKGELPWK